MSGEIPGAPRRLNINPHTAIHVGRLVHVTRQERRELEELATRMTRASFYAKPGWFAEYVVSVNRASRIIQEAISRAHAGS